jgi:phosphate transport system substrate-binding protein
MTTTKILLGILLAAAMSVSVAADDNDLVVVVNKANAITNLSKSQLRKIVLGEQTSWPGGARITIVLQAPGSAERESVLRSICRMSEDDYNQHQLHASFSGETNVQPTVASSPQTARQWVASTAGAIGFLRLDAVNATVKPISVDAVSPGQPDYKLKVGK